MLSAASENTGWSNSTARQKQAQTLPKPGSSTDPVLHHKRMRARLKDTSGGVGRKLHIMR